MLVWPLKAALLKLSKHHVLNNNRRQLVVLSFDQIAHSINIDGVYEKVELDTFFGWLTALGLDTRQSIALDIGANIGNHSLYLSDYFKEVYSIEPNTRTFKILSLNAELVSNVKCFNYGLSEEARTASMNINPCNSGESSVTDVRGSGDNSVELKTLDTCFTGMENLQLIKLDVEGHELQVLKGAEKTIKNNLPIILFEQHESDFSQGQSPVIALLRDYGYRKFAVINRHPRIEGGFLRKLLVTPFLRLVFGEKGKLKLVETVPPGFHPFIVALPEWLSASAAAAWL